MEIQHIRPTYEQLVEYLERLRERTPHPFLKAEIDELIGKSD